MKESRFRCRGLLILRQPSLQVLFLQVYRFGQDMYNDSSDTKLYARDYAFKNMQSAKTV